MLPSIPAINEIMTNEGLYIDKKNMFGLDYAETLKGGDLHFKIR